MLGRQIGTVNVGEIEREREGERVCVYERDTCVAMKINLKQIVGVTFKASTLTHQHYSLQNWQTHV